MNFFTKRGIILVKTPAQEEDGTNLFRLIDAGAFLCYGFGN
jgi:hypothetical protein